MNNLFAFLPMVVSNDLLDDAGALGQRLVKDGYLYFEQVLDRGRLEDLRRAISRVTQHLGWTAPGEEPTQRCIVAPLREDDAEFIDGYQEIQRLQAFHELAHDNALLSIMRSVLGDSAFPHPLKIARVAFPDNYEVTTPPHQDFPNNQGTAELTAAWIPVCDMGPELGGLAVLRGSHRWGLLPVAGSMGAGNRCAVIPPDMAEECHWVTTEFAMGDLLLFSSMTVHAALHNASHRLRLSVDFRYQLEGQALTEGCLEPHFGRISWEDVYEGWTPGSTQYYWRDLRYDVVPFEPIEIQRGGGRELSEADSLEVLRYQLRVAARTARRMKALDLPFEERERHSTTFERHQEATPRPAVPGGVE